eukprot:16901-Hanusia_phi.AAC.1
MTQPCLAGCPASLLVSDRRGRAPNRDAVTPDRVTGQTGESVGGSLTHRIVSRAAAFSDSLSLGTRKPPPLTGRAMPHRAPTAHWEAGRVGEASHISGHLNFDQSYDRSRLIPLLTDVLVFFTATGSSSARSKFESQSTGRRKGGRVSERSKESLTAGRGGGGSSPSLCAFAGAGARAAHALLLIRVILALPPSASPRTPTRNEPACSSSPSPVATPESSTCEGLILLLLQLSILVVLLLLLLLVFFLLFLFLVSSSSSSSPSLRRPRGLSPSSCYSGTRGPCLDSDEEEETSDSEAAGADVAHSLEQASAHRQHPPTRGTPLSSPRLLHVCTSSEEQGRAGGDGPSRGTSASATSLFFPLDAFRPSCLPSSKGSERSASSVDHQSH